MVLALIHQLLLVVNFVEISDLLPTLLSQLSDENFSSALKKLVASSPNLGGKWPSLALNCSLFVAAVDLQVGFCNSVSKCLGNCDL